MGYVRGAIISNTFPEYLQQFFWNYFQSDKAGEPRKYPRWCVDALRSVDVDLLEGKQEGSVDVIDGSGAKWEYSDKKKKPRSRSR
jgi:queuine tRNA-ribosyltransferase